MSPACPRRRPRDDPLNPFSRTPPCASKRNPSAPSTSRGSIVALLHRRRLHRPEGLSTSANSESVCASGAEAHVVKNTIFKIAATEAGIADLGATLDGTDHRGHRPKDISAAAKVLKTFAAEFDRPKVRFGFLDNQHLGRRRPCRPSPTCPPLRFCEAAPRPPPGSRPRARPHCSTSPPAQPRPGPQGQVREDRSPCRLTPASHRTAANPFPPADPAGDSTKTKSKSSAHGPDRSNRPCGRRRRRD
jgi:hypothetical protein